MPRLKKPQVVDTYIDNSTMAEYPIWLDREKMEFFVVVNNEKIYDPLAAEVRKKLITALEQNAPLLWVPVIELRSDTWIGDRSDKDEWGKLSLIASRYYLTLRSGGAVRKSTWDLRRSPYDRKDQDLSDDEYRLKNQSTNISFPKNEDGSLRIPYRFAKVEFGNAHSTVLPYTDETWENVVRMTSALKELAKKVEKLYARVDETDLLAHVFSQRTLALGSGEQTTE